MSESLGVLGGDVPRVEAHPQYDTQTGAVVKSIVDVNTTFTADFQDLSASWSTPAGGGLHLVSTFDVDRLGRRHT